MPTMPTWATGGRIVWDDAHGLAFIRHGLRRSTWVAYVRSGDNYVEMENIPARNNLERIHESAMQAIGSSIGEMVVSLHPGAAYTHLIVRDKTRTYVTLHACGINYSLYKSAQTVTEVTCPTCLAILAEDMAAKAGQIGFEKFEAKREEVRTVRAFNAFGKVVTGEQATEHDI